ncbi:MAG: division/cell wall cluster transcriptional repressor MraZ [Proteobacteria bacterium]|nr:division/cell wall cluster transcriptional repressor MraZ [Pseudomonadota bacterium]
MFRGRHSHTLDNKGRVSIPAAFRMELQRRSEKAPVLTNDTDCLALYPHDQWEHIEADLLDNPQMHPDVETLWRFMEGEAVDAAPDSQGRILIPAHLREHAGLKTKVVIVGVGPRIEIWDQTAYQAHRETTVRRLPDIKASVARLKN